ncbi:LysR family transcriptional regulator [Ammoniphilus sp. 3BR4]|uniref:LysR family transcriptional regulator n=1 Tax=Ammoniphilus sp. 3BR4 TaxID=3158265 RepID=UPI003467C064
MELRQLQYFQMVSKLNSITRAAELLHVSQPSVTIAIQKLEEEIGVQLLDRSQKRLSLTVEGRVFFLKIEDILNRLDDTISEMKNYRDLQTGILNIGVPPMMGSFLFPSIFSEFRKLYPHLELSIQEEGSLVIHQKLESGELDIGIVNISRPSPRIETLMITQEEIVAVFPINHPLVNNTAISFEQLRDQPLIIPKDTILQQVLLEKCQEHQFSPNIILQSSQLETIRRLVAQGVGISFLLDKIAYDDNHTVALPFENTLYLEIGLAWKKDKYLSKTSQAFIRFINEQHSLHLHP